MQNEWTDLFLRYEVVLFDYPAYFEIGRLPVFLEIVDSLSQNRSKIVTSSSYEQYEICVRNTHLPNGNKDELLFPDSDTYFDRMEASGCERIIEPEMSMFEVFKRYADQDRVCLLTGCHSPILSQIRLHSAESSAQIIVFDHDKYDIFTSTNDYLERNHPAEVNSVASSSEYLDVGIYVNVGDRVFTPEGKAVLLSEKISTGAEGLVFKTNDATMVAKIYHRGVMTPLRWLKLTRMTKLGLKAKGVCWPNELLYNSNHEPVGFTMPRAEGYTLGSVFDGQDAILERFPDWNRASVVRAAQQVFEKMIYLHLSGILIGDIQLKNAMIKNSEETFLIDMDSVQLEDLPCPVGTEEFTPPELWDTSFQTFLRSPLHEDYSCGILAFSMLFCGQHPYNQRMGKETLREEIASLSFPYDIQDEDNSRIPLGGYDQIWMGMPDHLRRMIYEAFADGKRFETIDWHHALSVYLKELLSKRYENEAYYDLFPYSNRKRILEASRIPNVKRSIMDAIIHVPDQKGNSSQKEEVNKNPVLYNGRPIGDAFLNQNKLVDVDLKRHAGFKGVLEVGTSDDKKNSEEVTATSADVNKDSNEKKRKCSRLAASDFGLSRMSILLIILIVLLLTAMFVFFNMFRLG